MSAELDDLIVAASSGVDGSIAGLASKVNELEASALRESAENFDLLFDTWNEAETFTSEQASFVLKLAERDALESQAFRNALYETAKVLLPPYLSSQAVLKMIGARDTAVQPHEAAARILKLQKVPTGALVSFADPKNWGKLSSVERVTGTFSIQSLKTGSHNSHPISIAFSSSLFFEPHPDMYNMIMPGKNLPSSADYRKAFKTHCLAEISDERVKTMVQGILVPDCFTAESFEAWWSKEAPAANAIPIPKP